MSYPPILKVVRGGVTESIHHGAICVSDNEGKIISSWGSPEQITFLRSSAKPFQALPLLESGASKAYQLSAQELALVCASHSGTEEHVSIAESIQVKIGITEHDLQCGTHPPFDRHAALQLKIDNRQPSPNQHNCSGKHSGMLALSRFLNEPIEDYLNPKRPVQQRVLASFLEMAGIDEGQIEIGIDGCSAPIFAASLRATSLAYARLADPRSLPDVRKQACHVIWDAMTDYPHIVAGEDRFDTRLMKLGEGRILSKGGAEGFQGIAIAPGAGKNGASGIGIAIKIGDGDLGKRARSFITLAVLRALDILDEEQSGYFSDKASSELVNYRGIKIGELQAVFKL